MALNELKPLFESGLLNEATRDAINEAWEKKLAETRSVIRVEMREEFAARYTHDRETMIESLDKMTSEALEDQIKKIQLEQKQAIKHRVKTVSEMKTVAKKFNNFLTTKLHEEIQQFRNDQVIQKAAISKLENFVMQSLAEEITDFGQDRKELIETRVKLISEANNKFNQLKTKFIKRSSKAVQETVGKVLRKELTQLHEDISIARRNNFGRKIFEAFSSEFVTTHLNENAEVKKVQKQLEAVNTKLSEAKQAIARKNTLLENKNRAIATYTSRNEREKILSELMNPLAKEKQALMSELLESVQTEKLKTAYDRYLPAVLSNKPVRSERMLSESRNEVTGNKRAVKQENNDENDSNIIDIKRLAGLK